MTSKPYILYKPATMAFCPSLVAVMLDAERLLITVTSIPILIDVLPLRPSFFTLTEYVLIVSDIVHYRISLAIQAQASASASAWW